MLHFCYFVLIFNTTNRIQVLYCNTNANQHRKDFTRAATQAENSRLFYVDEQAPIKFSVRVSGQRIFATFANPMKLLLIQPPVRDFYDTGIRLQPLGLCCLKAAVKKYLPGVEVKVKDYHHGWGRKTVRLPGELSDLRFFYAWPDQSPFSTFYHYFHFGAGYQELAEDVAREQPDVVGISSLFTAYAHEALECARKIKEKRDVPVIMGGAHVSAMPGMMLQDPAVDFVITGEGERPLVEFLCAWTGQKDFRRVPNLGFKENRTLVFNPSRENYPFENLPAPDFSDFPAGRYLYEKKPLSFLMASRGCPYRCSFCSVHATFGRGYRRRSAEDVADEIESRYREGIRVFDFEDDNLTYDRAAMERLCHILIEKFSAKDIRFLAMNGLAYWDLDVRLLGLMKQAGFTNLNIALVTAKQAVGRQVRRFHDPEYYRMIVGEAYRLGFQIVSYQILGLPGDRIEGMIEALQFQARLPVLLGASPFYLIPGTREAETFAEFDEAQVLRARLTALGIKTAAFDRGDIYTLFVATRILNFLKKIPWKGKDLSFDEAMEFAKKLTGRHGIGEEILRRLFREGVLHAATRGGLRPLPGFKEDLFFRLWEGLNYIKLLDGKTLWCDV